MLLFDDIPLSVVECQFLYSCFPIFKDAELGNNPGVSGGIFEEFQKIDVDGQKKESVNVYSVGDLVQLEYANYEGDIVWHNSFDR